MNVLSLFDGMSCGQQALERSCIIVDNYFASEIDKYAIQVTMHNYPNTQQLGSVVYLDGYSLPKIDLLIGGSPCQSFSFAGKRKGMSTKCEIEILTLEHYLQLKNDGYEFEGQSYLFWEYMRILNEVKPTYFLLENVEMGERWERILSKAIGVNGIHINSSLVSAQNRRRIYWTNISLKSGGLFNYPQITIQQPKDKKIFIKDIIEQSVNDKYFLSDKLINTLFKSKSGKNNGFKQAECRDYNDKASTLTVRMHKMGRQDNYVVHNMMPRSGDPTKGGTGHLQRNDGKSYCLDTGNTSAVEIIAVQIGQSANWGNCENGGGKSYCLQENSPHGVKLNSRIRRFTPLECERLQTVKDNYTNIVSDTQRYKMLGNGWTIDVIAHIFSYLPNEYKQLSFL